MGNKITMPRVALTGSAAMILLLASCQGRTTENMVPKGETVEVVINSPADAEEEVSDNTTNQTDSLQNEI